jgi:outer membrane biosynthesis protein TonB
MAAQAAKVLRVGVIRNGKIVEERVLPGRPVVTIGTSPKSTLVIPGAQLPATVQLFGWHGEKCLLSFGSGTQGRINGPQGEADLQALVAQGLAARQGAGYVVPIREDQRGKLMLGDVTILWQFVTPAPEAPRPAIASVQKGNHFQSMDRLFVSMLLLSFVLHSGFYAALAAVPVKQQDATLEEIPDRYARVLVPEKREAPKLPEKTSEATAEVKVETPAETKKEPEKGKKGEPGPDSPEHKAAHAAAVAKAVQSKGILKVLGALGPGTGGKGAVADVFGSGGGTGDVATALAGAGGVTVAAGGDAGMGQRKGGGQGGAASIGSLATAGGGGGKVGYGAKAEVKVTGSVAAETAEIDSSEVDQAKLGAFVRARMSLLKACYENALKRNPGLKGRMRIRFTILETGGLQDVSTVENALGSEVSSCVVNAMRGWRLPFRPSGPVTVDYPLVFTPGG